MQKGQGSAVAIAQAYLDRIAAIDLKGPALRSVLETNPEALGEAKALDAERQSRKGPRAAAWDTRAHERQHRYGGQDDDDGRIAGAGGSAGAAGCVRRGAAAGCGRRDSRQDQFERVGELSVDQVHRAAGAGAAGNAGIRTCSIATRPDRAREPARRSPPISRPSASELRPTDRSSALESTGPGRDQADARPRQPRRHHSDRPLPGHRRSDGANGRRCRDPARPHWPASTPRMRRRRRVPATAHRDYTQFLDAAGLEGARIGIAEEEVCSATAAAQTASAPTRLPRSRTPAP